MENDSNELEHVSSANTLQGRDNDLEKETLEQPNQPNGGNDKPDELQEEKRDGGESGRPAPLQPVGFWHHRLYHVRNHVLRLWLKIILILSVFILCILSLYWGALYRVEKNLFALTVLVVDFDGQVAPYNDTGITPLLGPMITQATEQIANSPGSHLGFVTASPAEYNNDPIAVRQAIYDFHHWAAIIVNANATALLQSAVQNGNTSYDPAGAAQLIYVEARDEATVGTYIVPICTQLETDIVTKFGEQWTKRVLSNDSIPRSTLASVPQALSPAIGFTNINLRPFGPAVVTPAVSVGLIYLIILAFFSFSFFLPIHMKYLIPKGHPPLHFHQLVIWRWVATVSAYFFMSFFYSIISLAFQIPFSTGPASQTEPAFNPTAYGKGTFPVYWMLNFVGMTALGLACENVAMFVGQPWTAFWLIFWVITNVCTSFYSLPTAPTFYYWGYAWPLHNIVEASRQLFFDLHSRIGLNFGILFAWCAINTTLFPIMCYWMRSKNEREKKKATIDHHHKGR